jgi:hypothetical protein
VAGQIIRGREFLETEYDKQRGGVMTLTKEDRARIVARAFYEDNRDQYEDYRHALTEFMNQQNTSEEFMKFAVEPFVKPKEGHSIWVNDVGHVLAVRAEDGFVEPIFEMTDAEFEELQEHTENAVDANQDADEFEIMEMIGWRRIA